MKLEYYHNSQSILVPPTNEEHNRVLVLLDILKQSGKVSEVVTLDLDTAFPDEPSKQQFFEQIRDFGMRHRVGLGRVFGSRKHGFTYLPPQFLLVKENAELKEVFPCEIGGVEKGVIAFLEALNSGMPWTTHLVSTGRKIPHEQIVEKIIRNPDALERGLHLEGRNVQVSQGFGELGYIDLIFKDRGNRYLLVEVKVKPAEIDKAFGQILRHRKLFIRQNSVLPESVRLAIACPNISMQQREICKEAGIECFELA